MNTEIKKVKIVSIDTNKEILEYTKNISDGVIGIFWILVAIFLSQLIIELNK